MTRKEKIEDLRNQIDLKQQEITELKKQINSERVADFYERHNLKESQHFLYEGKECVGVECEDCTYGPFKTHRVKKDGSASLQRIIIIYEENIKPI